MPPTSMMLRFLEDEDARRELLWLRAKEEGDELAARDLEYVDPSLIDRLRAAGVDVDEHPGEGPAERRKRFARLWDECWTRHEQRLLPR